MPKDLITITCASGKQCRHLLPLLSSSYRLRLIVHRPESQSRLQKQYPEAEVLALDLSDPSNYAQILRDTNVLLHINPTFHPNEDGIGKGMLNAAIEERKREGNGLRHFIFSSVLQSGLTKMLNHIRKAAVEEYIVENCGGPDMFGWTILQPAHLSDTYVGIMVKTGRYKAMWDPEIPYSFLALKDLADVSAQIIAEGPRHYFATYPLCSTGPIKYTDVVKEVGKAIGKDIPVERVEYSKAVDQLCNMISGSADVDQRFRDAPERLLLFYNRRGLVGSPTVLEMLLGRKGTGHGEVAKSLMESSQ